jgi:branched-chain amino acid transport system substrate-binding protein
MYIAGQCIEAAMQSLSAKADDRSALAEGLHQLSLTDTPRGPVKFDHLSNIVGDVFIRKCERMGGKLDAGFPQRGIFFGGRSLNTATTPS